MNTTSLLIEIIVIGAVALLWLVPPVLSIAPNQLHHLLRSSTPAVLVVGIAILYAVGLTINFLSDRLMSPIQRRLAKELGGKRQLQKARAHVLLQGAPAVEYLHQRRSIVRIFRAMALNAALIALVWAWGSAPEIQTFGAARWAVVATAIVACLIATWAFIRTLRGYFSLLLDLKEVVNGTRDIGRSERDGKASADRSP